MEDQHSGPPSPQPAKTMASRKSTKTILLSTSVVCIPLIIFSAVLLGLVFHYKVGEQPSTGREIPGGFYLVNFPAARLIFISSWSSSVAPKITGVATGLYFYHAVKGYIRRSSMVDGRRDAGLPTPYQVALAIGLSGGSLTQLWKYSTYRNGSHKAKNVSMLRQMSFILILFQVLGLLIFALDSVVHFTTEAISINTQTANSGDFSSFGQGITAACAAYANSGATTFATNVPCTYNIAGTGDGLTNATEVSATVNGVSATHHLLNYTMSDTGADLIVLGPALDVIPGDMQFKASSVGVSTSCKPVSLACGLYSRIGASTPFHCSDSFYGDIQIPQINSTADLWSADGSSFMFGAEFFDSNFSQPYANHTVFTAGSTAIDTNQQPSSFVLALAVRTSFGTSSVQTLQTDPEIILPEHGGLAFILSCNVATYDVTYTYFNNSITNVDTSPANGSTTWLWNSVMGGSGTIAHLQDGIDVASNEPTADALAHTWSRFYSEQAVAVLASAFDGRPNLEESFVQTSIVTKIARGPLMGLVALNLMFALAGLLIGIVALVGDSAAVTAVSGGLSVEGLVGMLFGREGVMVEGMKVKDCFEEMTTGAQEKVAVQQVREGGVARWNLVQTSGTEVEQVLLHHRSK